MFFIYNFNIMIVESIYLKNFRNYTEQIVTLAPGLNVLVGGNAEGKTNMLESIYFCSTFSSPRATKDKEMIRFNQDYDVVKLFIKKKYHTSSIKIKITSNNKKYVLVNDLEIKRGSELLGELGVVFFSPKELKLIQESPDERRRFLNISISQQDKTYFTALGEYTKVLQDKNALLKKKLETEHVDTMLDVYDAQLAEKGAFIIDKRTKFLEILSDYSHRANNKLSDNKETLSLEYDSDVSLNGNVKENLYNSLIAAREKDKQNGFTSVGPHRDDIKIVLNGNDARKFSSQGQQRSITLAMKLAALYIYKKETGEYPVLLLDDVLSELDTNRQHKLLEMLKDIQIILTCTDYNLNVKGNIINIKNGKVV